MCAGLRGEQGDEQDLGVAPDRLPDCRVRVSTHVVSLSVGGHGVLYDRKTFQRPADSYITLS